MIRMITIVIKAKLYQLSIEPSCFMQIKLLSSFYGWINFLVVQTVKNLPAMRETQVQSRDREDLLEKEVATHSSILAWRIP